MKVDNNNNNKNNRAVTGVVVETAADEEREEETTRSDISKSIHERTTEAVSGWANDWARCVVKNIKNPLVGQLVKLTRHAATYPKTYIIVVIVMSILLMAIGFATNYTAELDEDKAWTPTDSRALSHGNWIDDVSGFPEDPRYLILQLHKEGDNVMPLETAKESVERLFEAVDRARAVEGYEELCFQHTHAEWDYALNNYSCPMNGIGTFWNESSALFQEQVSTNEETIQALSALVYPNGQPVDRSAIFGYAKEVDSDDPSNHSLESAQSFVSILELTPIDDEAEKVEKRIIDEILDLRDEWAAQGTPYRMEVLAYRSFDDEMSKAIVSDLPLIPVVFIVMAILCIVIFSRRDRVQSRGALGFGAVVTVLLAIVSGYGILFIAGVPFSFLTQILPFVMFGIGLDDAFIIYGSYSRTDPDLDAPDRVALAIADIGGSITLTTLTTVMAFGLGCISSIPAVYWLCLYAFPTVLIDFLYQLTFFIAILSLDERRVKAKRKDCCCCRRPLADEESNDASRSEPSSTTQVKVHLSERMMQRYGKFLTKTWVKIVVIIAFTGLFGACIYSTSQLTQSFNFIDLVPDDSYLVDSWNAFRDYYERSGVRPGAYFRWVDQSDWNIQAQMEKYVKDLVQLDEISDPPVFFWFRDFQVFNETDAVKDLPFNDQVAAFLQDPIYGPMYAKHMVLNGEGILIESRTILEMDNVEQDNVKDAMNALKNQRRVSASQPINQGASDWYFFTFDGSYYIWEFYAVTADEMILTSIVGVVAVSAITLLAIPHWTGIFFIAPLVMILYVDLLGIIQFSGLNVNSVTYIGLVLSIGLIVDYCMHFLLRYIESKGLDREKRVQESLKTIGASVMLGGLSTFLGVVPLGFASSSIIRTVFVIFIALVALGLSHGLILLPVVLSLIGPLNYLEELHGERDGESDEGKSTPKASSNSDVEQAIDARPEQAPDVTAVDDEGMDEVSLGRAPSFDA